LIYSGLWHLDRHGTTVGHLREKFKAVTTLQQVPYALENHNEPERNNDHLLEEENEEEENYLF
jgi:hypothetical protein